jgi:hypothetical protein
MGKGCDENRDGDGDGDEDGEGEGEVVQMYGIINKMGYTLDNAIARHMRLVQRWLAALQGHDCGQSCSQRW